MRNTDTYSHTSATEITTVLATLVLLKQQLGKAISDLKVLNKSKESALKDPTVFFNDIFCNKKLLHSNQQKYATIPPLDLDSFLNSASLESLELFLINTESSSLEKLQNNNDNNLSIYDTHLNANKQHLLPKRERKERISFSYKNYSNYFNERFNNTLSKSRFGARTNSKFKKQSINSSNNIMKLSGKLDSKSSIKSQYLSNKRINFPLKSNNKPRTLTEGSFSKQTAYTKIKNSNNLLKNFVSHKPITAKQTDHNAFVINDDKSRLTTSIDADSNYKKTNNLKQPNFKHEDSDFFSETPFPSSKKSSYNNENSDTQSDHDLFILTNTVKRHKNSREPNLNKSKTPTKSYKKKNASIIKSTTPGYQPPPPSIYNKPWTDQEQNQLEKLLTIYPDEPVANNRWRKISNALGTRTMRQVASRVQKYFIKLNKAGKPIPGRLPDFTKWSSLKRENRNHNSAENTSSKARVKHCLSDSSNTSGEKNFEGHLYLHSNSKSGLDVDSDQAQDSKKHCLPSTTNKPYLGKKRGRKPKNHAICNIIDSENSIGRLYNCSDNTNSKADFNESDLHYIPPKRTVSFNNNPNYSMGGSLPLDIKSNSKKFKTEKNLSESIDEELEIDIEIESSDSEKPLVALVLDSKQKDQNVMNILDKGVSNDSHERSDINTTQTAIFKSDFLSVSKLNKNAIKSKKSLKQTLENNLNSDLKNVKESCVGSGILNQSLLKYNTDKDIDYVKETLTNSIPNVQKNSEPSNINIRKSILHLGYSCDGCFSEPIVGTRWHCIDCTSTKVKLENNELDSSRMEKPLKKSNKKDKQIQKPITDFDLCDECMVEHSSNCDNNKQVDHIHNQRHKFMAITIPDFEPDPESVFESAIENIIDPMGDTDPDSGYTFYNNTRGSKLFIKWQWFVFEPGEEPREDKITYVISDP
ncbi:hypothetical protein BB561_004102 [Smittium simulii]|uniref:Uncharacterized protein n=1 Tax=Smittium simulii TaxID=133385 RepID=A0A2T9YI13_9FUNG|nr:hypothetical protein BB561_004102 [Smittium simulii]